MRTTLTIDDDVAAMLEQLRKKRSVKLKDIVNEALRRGLADLAARQTQRDHFQTRSVDLGRLKISSIDNIAEALAIAEGESFD
jgi:hypothetical protein